MKPAEPPDSGWLINTGNIAGFAYGIGVSIGILLLITTISLASYYCTRNHLSASPMTTPRSRRRRQTNQMSPRGVIIAVEQPSDDQQPPDVLTVVSGLDEETIKSLPRIPYEEARESYGRKREASTTSCCSICLADYNDRDMIRVLPDCNHIFHDKCVDPWLFLSSTCPVCRTSPYPSPSPSPVAGVIPRG
ncbi:PREDICTED: putative RING-H2 finger protein ATL71 [Tarenaya hassleriana]|uniref:putative RING-H2 finger protein ATL71 n=1 Tax=Tarenaya hassleriana TaxID=28532 RepID=UPI00053C082A|nr:PREDICTED: putative RING-H2 finger protein ATL71 [Tarenaya hassleriana]